MPVAIAYIFVVLIWATTPLAVKWSNDSLSFISAISLRMVIALLICSAILAILRRPLVQDKKDWMAFCAVALGFFPTMALCYWSAQHIPSGLVSILFGFYPFMAGFFSLFILKENIFNRRRTIALTIAVTGLIIINADQLLQADSGLEGVLICLLAVVLFGLSSVWLKKIGANIDPIRQTTGGLLVSLPGFFLTWFFIDGHLPVDIGLKSALSVGYLSLAGTVLGGTAFFYVIQRCSISSVGLITLSTPIMAMILSIHFEGEHFSDQALVGISLVIASLGIYQKAERYIASMAKCLFRGNVVLGK